MKTKIRIQESEGSALGAKYKHMHIQILTPRYTGARYLEPMGEITFQMTVGDPEGYRWYAMTFKVETDNVDYIKGMARIAKYIKEKRSSHNAQPAEIIQLIGGEEHVNFNSEFIPITDKGKSIFKVIRQGSLYDHITAPNEIIAQEILDKKKIEGAKLEFHTIINF